MKDRRPVWLLIVSWTAFLASVAAVAAWLGSDALRLRLIIVHTAIAVMLVGGMAGVVAAMLARTGGGRVRVWFSSAAVALNMAGAVLLFLLAQVGLALPPYHGKLFDPGTLLPAFESPLLDTDAHEVADLGEYRGEPLVLFFFRGHW